MTIQSGTKNGKEKSQSVASGGKIAGRPVKKLKSRRSLKRKQKEPEVEVIWE